MLTHTAAIHSFFLLLLLDQLWTLSGTKLFNKKRKSLKLSLDDRNWILPLSETEGTIQEQGAREVLGLRRRKDCAFGKKVSEQDRGEIQFTCEPATDSQLWFRSKSDIDGYFTLKNVENGLLLTASSKTKFKVTGMFADYCW